MGVQLLQLTFNCLMLLKRYWCDLLDSIAVSFKWVLWLLFRLFLWQQHSTPRSNGSLAKYSLQVDTRWGEAKAVVGTLGGVDVVLLARYSRKDPSTWQGLLFWQGHFFIAPSRHGTSHSVPPGEVNYRANIWALRWLSFQTWYWFGILCEFRELGVTHVLATTACGSLREAITPGLFLVHFFVTVGR